MYLDVATLVHRVEDVTSCHPSLAAIAVEKESNLFIPHPPHFFGSAKESQFDQAKILLGWFPLHRNLQHRFLILDRIPLGIHAKDIQ